MPLRSMSKVTSICGTPRGAGAMPVSSNVPSGLLSRASSRSPWKTWMSTCDWLSSAVVNDLGRLGRDRRVALDQLGHDPALGLDAEAQRGDVDQQDVLALALEDAGLQGGADGDDLVRVHALVGLLAAGQLLDELGDGGHPGRAADEDDVVDLVDGDPGVLDDLLERRLGALSRSAVICWNCARVSFSSRCTGPFSVIERYCSEMLVAVALDSSFFACSAASRSRCMAILSLARSTPVVFFTVVTRWSTTRWSQSSPPRWLSPEVACTWIVAKPSSSLLTSSRETSNVPPPRSKTRMSSSSLPLSRP